MKIFLKITSKYWNIIGIISLFIGTGLVTYSGVNLTRYIHHVNDITANFMFYAAIKSMLILGICGACARYAFSLGGKYLHESLKIADRTHAIRFGGIYIQIYGTTSKWDEIKDAFSHWNVSAPTAFGQGSAQNIEANRESHQ